MWLLALILIFILIPTVIVYLSITLIKRMWTGWRKFGLRVVGLGVYLLIIYLLHSAKLESGDEPTTLGRLLMYVVWGIISLGAIAVIAWSAQDLIKRIKDRKDKSLPIK